MGNWLDVSALTCNSFTSQNDWFIVFNATFNNISVISVKFYWWRKPEYPKKTTDLLQVTDTLSDQFNLILMIFWLTFFRAEFTFIKSITLMNTQGFSGIERRECHSVAIADYWGLNVTEIKNHRNNTVPFLRSVESVKLRVFCYIYTTQYTNKFSSVPITTKVVSLNPVHGKVYTIQHFVTKFLSNLRQVSGFL
jgi:hypothetical protein